MNIIIDVLGGYSKELCSSVRDFLGAERSRECLRRMQKSVLSSSLNIEIFQGFELNNRLAILGTFSVLFVYLSIL